MAGPGKTRLINPSMTITFVVAVIFQVSALAAGAPDQAEIEKITEKWVCKWCPDPSTSEGEVTAGAGYVSNDSYKHGDYTGLSDKGAYAIAGFDYAYQDNNGKYVNASGAELGLDSRNVSVEGGNHGHISGVTNWNMTGGFSYSELPKLNLDTARTPYRGSSSLQLPSGWTAGDTTQNMPDLNSTLRDVDIYTNRKTFALAANYYQGNSLSYELGFQRDTKEGTRTAGLALGSSFALARSAILAIPVDYVTDQGELKINYTQRRWHAAISYQFSNFKNRESSVQWQNAFDTPAGATNGQAALEPDNTMQKITLTGAYQFTPLTSSNILIAYGRMEQDDDFLPYTITSPPALPASSLDGKINTLDAIVNFQSRLTETILLEAKYQHNEQDNDTSRNTYSYIIADTSPAGTARANFPYSFRKASLQVLGHYQLPQHKVSLGIQQNNIDRTYQEVENTTENIVKASYRTSMIEKIDFQVRGEVNNRDGDKYQAVADIQPPENDLLRKYNLADRKRNQLGISLSYHPSATWQLAAYMDASKDDYSDSEIGLLESIQKDYSIALGYIFNEAITFNIDYTLTTIESTQAGSDTFSDPTWQATNDDQIDVIHLGISYTVIPDKFDTGFDYSYANAKGDIEVSTDEALPSLKSKRHTFVLHGDYRLNEKSTVTAFYRYEKYEESDWAVDDVAPNTIPHVLSLGEVSPSYDIGVLGAAIKYAF